MKNYFQYILIFQMLGFVVLAQTQIVKLSSGEFVGDGGLTIEKLTDSANAKRPDLQAFRQKILIAEAKVLQANLRPNPTLSGEYGSPRFLAGKAESDFSIELSQTFEIGGKRQRRTEIANLELSQTRLEVAKIEREVAVEVRKLFTRANAAAMQLDVFEQLIAVDAELIQATEARLKEGDVAPLDLNLVKVEHNRLRVQAIDARGELETTMIELKALIGLQIDEPLKIASQNNRPTRMDLSLNQVTAIALRERADLKSTKIAEQIGAVKINLANLQRKPNLAASVKYSRGNTMLDLPISAGGGFAVDKNQKLTFGVSVDLPIFNKYKADAAIAEIEQYQATKTREFLEATIKKDVAVAFRKYKIAAEKLVIISTQIVPLSEANLKSIKSAYGLGEFSVFEVVNEQRRLTENVTEYNKAVQSFYDALNDLETAIGSRLPNEAFSPETSSILPDEELVNQVNKETLLRSLFTEKKEKPVLIITQNKKP